MTLFLSLACITLFLHTVRIFHVFYTTLKPAATARDSNNKQQVQNRVCSIQGIFINRHYSGMRFAFQTLFQPLEEGLSRGCSLNFYGTQEKKDEDPSMPLYVSTESTGLPSSSLPLRSLSLSLSPSPGQYGNSCFHAGRPNWALIFQKAIFKAHFSDPNGATIGVFFCGSPAISKSLMAMADKITAQHQYSMKKKKGKISCCNCKIVVHTENF